MSPIAIAQDVIGLALATQQHGGILFRQGGQIGGVITHPGTLSKEAADRIANSWRETHAGVQNAHKVAILEEGMTFDKIAMTNEDSAIPRNPSLSGASIFAASTACRRTAWASSTRRR